MAPHGRKPGFDLNKTAFLRVIPTMTFQSDKFSGMYRTHSLAFFLASSDIHSGISSDMLSGLSPDSLSAMAYLLTFFLAYLLTFFLAYLLTFFLAYLLPLWHIF